MLFDDYLINAIRLLINTIINVIVSITVTIVNFINICLIS